MDRTILEHSWNENKEKLISKYPILTEKNLEYEEGNEEQLIGDLEAKLSKTNEEIKEILKSLQPKKLLNKNSLLIT